MVQHYVKGEYTPPSFGYSSSQQFQPAETQREISNTGALPAAHEAPEVPMHETSDVLGKAAGEPPARTEEMVQEKGKQREQVEAVIPFAAWNPAR